MTTTITALGDRIAAPEEMPTTFTDLEFGSLILPARLPGVPVPSGSGYVVPAGSLAILHPFGDTRFYRHGWNSWSPSGWARLSGETVGIKNSPERLLTADDARNETPHQHTGSAVGALEGDAGHVLLIGALGLGSPRVGADENTMWGRTESDESPWFVAYGPEDRVFAEYTDLVGTTLGRRTTRAGSVWSSWYSLYEEIDEQKVDDLVADLRGYPVDVFQLDDGWESKVGDWEAGRDFPSGMARTASAIAEAGFRPGLWLAPLIALPDSQIARERPDLMVQSETGGPRITGYNWGSHYYTLDTTQAEVREHLREVFSRVTQWGFSYLKLDFMYAGAVDGVRSTDVHRERVYRDAVEHIRDVVGDDVYLLGSGVPMLPSAGVFDGARVGPDVGPFWDNAERVGDPSGVGALNAIQAALHRTWMKPLYEIDPDAVYFRSARNLLDAGERAILRDVAAATGFRSTSDPIAWLTADERDDLRAWMSGRDEVEQLGRYRFRIGERVVDLSTVAEGDLPSFPPSIAG